MASKHYSKLVWSTIGLLQLLSISVVGLQFGLDWLSEPRGEVVVLRGKQVTLNCSARSTLDPASSPSLVPVTWLKNGTTVDESTRHTLLPGGSLLLRRVTRKVEGRYQCIASNLAGSVLSHPITVRTAVLNKFASEPEDVSVVRGELARLHCHITGIPKPQVTWERDKQPIPQSPRYTLLSEGGVLQISDVNADDDAGLYRCTASNMAKTRHSQEATLSVIDQKQRGVPRILEAVGDHYSSRLGDPVVLECAATGNPKPEISWTGPDGKALDDPRFSMLGQGNLQITQVEAEDEGDYVCRAQNSVGTVTSQGTLQVIAAPIMLYDLENLYRLSAATCLFECVFDGIPTPRVWWTKNGRPLKQADRIQFLSQGSMLALEQSVVDDSGYYQCWAENAAGLTYSAVRLLVHSSQDAPGPPYDLRARQLSSQSVQLSWNESVHEKGFRILAFSVHYLPSNGGPELQTVVDTPFVVIDHLQPNTNYTFYVMAYNEHGASLQSEHITQKTGEDYPLSAPSVSLSPLGTTSLRVTWDSLSPEKARGEITEYRIVYRQHERPSEHIEHTAGDVHEYILTGLEPNVQYDVRVLASTAAGYPSLRDDAWPWITQITDGNMNEGLPEAPSMSVEVLDSKSLRVSWDPVKPTPAKMVGYKLFILTVPERKLLRFFIPTFEDDTNIVVQNLEPATMYELKLLALNDLGDGQETVRIVRTKTDGGGTDVPPPQIPLPPVVIEAEPLGESSIRLKWRPPDHTGLTTTYTVQYKPVKEEKGKEVLDESMEITVISEGLEVLIANLEPYMLYEFTIRSHQGDSESENSHAVRCRTKEGIPSAPRDPAWRVVDSVIVVSWLAPKNPNGLINAYIISYTDNQQLLLDQWSIKKLNGSNTSTKLLELSPDTTYYLCIQASTTIGQSAPTDRIQLHTGAIMGSSPSSATTTILGVAISERDKGIIAGVCIGGGCFIICAIIVVLRNRCCPGQQRGPVLTDPNASYNGNGCIPNHSNGNGTLLHYHMEGGGTDYTEMDSFSPLTPLQENKESDTKGGHDLIHEKGKNGKVNGLNGLNGLHHVGQNGLIRPPNGKLVTNQHDGIHGNGDTGGGGGGGPQLPERNSSLQQQQQQQHERQPAQVPADEVLCIGAEREHLLPPQASSSSSSLPSSSSTTSGRHSTGGHREEQGEGEGEEGQRLAAAVV